jgi:hypothetical protein
VKIDSNLREYVLGSIWDEYQGIIENNLTVIDFQDYCYAYTNLKEIGRRFLNYIGLDLEKIMED